MNQLSERYLEDFAVGQTFGSGAFGDAAQRSLLSSVAIRLSS